MKWFKRIFFGLVGLYLLALGLDILISKSLLKSDLINGELNVWHDIYEKNITTDLIFYGSSKSSVQINPKIIDEELDVNSYNFGFNGQKIKLQKLKHEELLNSNIIPKNVVINLEINTLTNNDVFKPYQFLPIILYRYNKFSFIKNDLKLYFADYFIPLIRFRKFKKYNINFMKSLYEYFIHNDKKSTIKYKGYLGVNRKWEDKFLPNDIIIEIVHERNNDLIEIIEDLKENDVNIIFIISPEYYLRMQKFINRDVIIEHYKQISNKYNIPLIDYSKDSINYRQEYFYDPNHLNSIGADIFTKKLAEDIKPYLKK